jgi:hypothetical protein
VKTRITGVIGTITVFLATASVALAQEPTGPAYGGVGPSIDEEVGDVAGEVVTTGTLPFTGFDVALALGVGLLLVAIGVLTRRLGRARA